MAANHRATPSSMGEVSKPTRKQLRLSPWSRPEVERATKHHHLLADVEVDRAAITPQRHCLLG
jgi:hypothetical protein